MAKITPPESGRGPRLTLHLPPTADSATIVAATTPAGLAADATYVYWTVLASGIGRAKLDGSGANANFITGLTNPVAIAVDATYIYWADGSAKRIGRAKLDGTSVEPSFITLAANVTGVAVDGTYIYWTVSSFIGRAKLAGTSKEESFVNLEGKQLQKLAVDASYIYFTSNLPSIALGRAKIDGTEAIRQWLAGEIGRPLSVAVDSRYLYWSQSLAGLGRMVGRALLDGSAVEPDFIASGAGAPAVTAIALGPHHVFWAQGGIKRLPTYTVFLEDVTSGKTLSLGVKQALSEDFLLLDFFRRTITDKDGNDRSALLSPFDQSLWGTSPITGPSEVGIKIHTAKGGAIAASAKLDWDLGHA